jgi:hypothetical protein
MHHRTAPFHGTAVAAIICVPGFHAVPDDLAAAVMARWCKLVNRALKTVVYVSFAIETNFHAFVVIVPAGFAFSHD